MKDALVLKLNLEAQISMAVREFQEKTGTAVTRIDIRHTYDAAGRVRTSAASVEVRL